MPLPIAQSLFQQIFGGSGSAISLTRPSETTDQEGEDVVRRGPIISFQDLLTRQFLGPSVLPKTLDTPSGKVFAPDEPVPAKPDILATYPEKKIETKEISTPMPTGEPQGIISLPIPETQDKLKGFETPKLPNFNILNQKLNELPEDKVNKFFEKQDSLYDNDYEIFFMDQKKLKQGVIPENKKYTFDDIIEQYGQYQPIHKYWESAWEGGVGNLGSREAGEIMRSGGMLQDEKGFTAPTYYEDYKTKLQELARKEFGRDFIGYRLMSKAEMDDLLNEGDAAFGVKSYSLKKKSAMAFKQFTNKAFIDMKTGKTREDLVLVEAPLDVEGLVMRGKSSEDEIVFDNQFVNSEQMNFYDLNGKLIKGAQSGLLTEDKKENIINNTKEKEIEKYFNERNQFWDQNQKRANETYPELNPKNLPQVIAADKHFGAAAFSFQDFSDSKLIYMSPQDYLNLTKKFRPAEDDEKLGLKKDVKNIENILKEGKELANIPMLYIKKIDNNFIITGQEGIHRAKAFQNLGYDKIPVVVEGYTGKDRKETKDFFPKSIQSKEGEVLLTKPEDFYSVIYKKKLYNKENTSNPTGSLIDKTLSNE